MEMAGITDLSELLRTMKPVLNEGDYVFCTVSEKELKSIKDIIMFFREKEGYTVILKQKEADRLSLNYSFIVSWITLTVHSSLEAVGLTAAFSKALSNEGISCNVVAAYYHDHIFIDKKDAFKAMEVLNSLSKESS